MSTNIRFYDDYVMGLEDDKTIAEAKVRELTIENDRLKAREHLALLPDEERDQSNRIASEANGITIKLTLENSELRRANVALDVRISDFTKELQEKDLLIEKLKGEAVAAIERGARMEQRYLEIAIRFVPAQRRLREARILLYRFVAYSSQHLKCETEAWLREEDFP
jgi:hypothetical protein